MKHRKAKAYTSRMMYNKTQERIYDLIEGIEEDNRCIIEETIYFQNQSDLDGGYYNE